MLLRDIVYGNFYEDEEYEKTAEDFLKESALFNSFRPGYATRGTGYATRGTGYATRGTGYATRGSRYANSPVKVRSTTSQVKNVAKNFDVSDLSDAARKRMVDNLEAELIRQEMPEVLERREMERLERISRKDAELAKHKALSEAELRRRMKGATSKSTAHAPTPASKETPVIVAQEKAIPLGAATTVSQAAKAETPAYTGTTLPAIYAHPNMGVMSESKKRKYLVPSLVGLGLVGTGAGGYALLNRRDERRRGR